MSSCRSLLFAACNPVFDYDAEFDVNTEECDVFVSIYDRYGAPDDDEGGFVGAGHLLMPLSRKRYEREEVLTCVKLALGVLRADLYTGCWTEKALESRAESESASLSIRTSDGS